MKIPLGVYTHSMSTIDLTLDTFETAIEQNEKMIGNCEAGYTCVYQNTVSWRDATTPMPMPCPRWPASCATRLSMAP